MAMMSRNSLQHASFWLRSQPVLSDEPLRLFLRLLYFSSSRVNPRAHWRPLSQCNKGFGDARHGDALHIFLQVPATRTHLQVSLQPKTSACIPGGSVGSRTGWSCCTWRQSTMDAAVETQGGGAKCAVLWTTR